jgi:trehalose-6-phosphate synthase
MTKVKAPSMGVFERYLALWVALCRRRLVRGRRIQVRAFPIGIDTEAFAQEARTAEKSSVVKRTLASAWKRLRLSSSGRPKRQGHA